MSRKLYTIILSSLLIGIVVTMGYIYTREMPQVSNDVTKEMLENYKDNLQRAYTDLNDNYNRIIINKKLEDWQDFSARWIPGLSSIRPKDIDKRLPSKYEGKRDLLLSTHSALISLWNEYNKDFTGDISREQRVNELKKGIENVFENLDI